EERAAAEAVVTGQLRRVDTAAWSSDGALFALLPEVGAEEAVEVATRIRNRLGRGGMRIGHVTCPDDGYEAGALLSRAREAAQAARPGKIAGREQAFQTLTVGGQRVIVADPTVARLYALIER